MFSRLIINKVVILSMAFVDVCWVALVLYKLTLHVDKTLILQGRASRTTGGEILTRMGAKQPQINRARGVCVH